MRVRYGLAVVFCVALGARAASVSAPLAAISVGNAWQVELLQVLSIPDYTKGAVSQASVCFSPDGRQLVAACGKSRVPVWDVQSGAVTSFLYENVTQVVACAYSPDGRWLSCGGFDRTITLWDLGSGQSAALPSANAGPVWELDFSPDSAKLASCSLSDDIRLWDVATRTVLWSYGGRHAYLSVAFAPSGEALTCGGRWDGVTTLAAADGRVLATPRGPDGVPVGDVAYARDGSLLAAGADDRTAYLWDSASSELAGLLRAHAGYVNGVAFSPDGTLLATGSHDQTVGIWDVAGRYLLTRLEGHTAQVLRVAFSPDGTLLASVSWDGTLRLWGVPQE